MLKPGDVIECKLESRHNLDRHSTYLVAGVIGSFPSKSDSDVMQQTPGDSQSGRRDSALSY
jgi:hypothetical protein